MRLVRQVHLYLGVLFAPTILFFAFTGALQTFGWHEGKRGESYQPPRWLEKLAQVHVHQTLVLRRRTPPPPPAAATVPDAERMASPPAAEVPRTPPAREKEPRALKWFIVFAAIGLITTTSLGFVMAFKGHRDRRVAWALLVLGIVLPTVLLL